LAKRACVSSKVGVRCGMTGFTLSSAIGRFHANQFTRLVPYYSLRSVG
jgi:hypothetical protein